MFAIDINKKCNIYLVHLFVVSVGASISMISISLDRREIQNSCFLANVITSSNLSGEMPLPQRLLEILEGLFNRSV